MSPDEPKSARLVVRITPAMDAELRDAAGPGGVAGLVTAAITEKLARLKFRDGSVAVVSGSVIAKGNGPAHATATGGLTGDVTVRLGKGPVQPRPKGGQR